MPALITLPGTYSPPTYGHFDIACRAAELWGNLTVVCSRNDGKKNNWFSAEECVRLWRAYDLPKNVTVTTLEKMLGQSTDFSQLVMTRGIRDDADFQHEHEVMKLNSRDYGINNYFYLMARPELKNISSSLARQAAQKLDFSKLAQCVPPRIVSLMLERALNINRLFLVTGRPGSGKSTWLKELIKSDPQAYWISGDEISQRLRPQVVAAFPGENLYHLAVKQEEKILAILKTAWLEILADLLRQAPPQTNVYLEVAYGLEANKQLYRLVGGRVINVYCQSAETNRQRIKDRGTPQHLPFVDKIPDREEALKIAQANGLELIEINTDGNQEGLAAQAQSFINRNINKN
ncbi:MAG: AAA family ATPase [Patescibacteria group bacterium]|jgi:pantetheine-phosphate adenylyltransferase